MKSSMGAKHAPLFAALALIGADCAMAQQTQEERTLDAVVVSASRSQAKVEEMPLHSTIVSQEDIRKSPATTLDQLLRNVPGMNFTGVPAALSDPTGHQTKMRGLGNAKVLVLLDGIPIHDPFYLTTQWFKVPLSNIERVEIIRGGNSSLWGNMAVAGVVNIVTRRVSDNAGEASASIGTQGTTNIALSKNVALSDALSFNLAADFSHTDGYQTTPAEFLYRFPQKQPVTSENKNIRLTTYFKPSADLSGYLRLGYHVQDQDISYQFGNNLQKSPDLAASLIKTFDDRASLQANAWAQYVNFQKFNGNTCYYQGGTTCLTSTSASLTPAKVNGNVVQFYTQQGDQGYREQGGSLIYSKNLRAALYSFQLGADYRRLSAQDTEWFYNTPTGPAAPQGQFNSSTHGEGAQTFQGVFAQAKIAPLDALDITVSGRYDAYRIDDRTNTRTLASGASTGGALPASTKSAFNPSLAVRYELNDRVSLRGATYKAFRAPGFNNLTRTFGTGSNTTIANPDLVPEDLRGWELGSDYRQGGFSAGATYFLYNISNMIATYTASGAGAPQQVQTICGGATLPGCSGSAKYYTNDQDGQSHGVELVASWDVLDSVTLNGFYTRTETYLTRRGAVVTDPLGVQLTGVPKNVASLGATWKPVEKLRTYAELRYIGPMLLDTTSNNATTRFEQGGNTIVNASASYAWSKTVEVFGNVVNLFDREYTETPYNVNQPYNKVLSMPRAVNVGVRMRF
ncbi:TonB-dependent receptor [Noviherbaspirillum sp. UKPF54]|uniref:TonB-dependent receptor n=1 Tax=Noviherbaspirillum sp. UKPF54 TaxID=2601898 RepID=UPI00143D41AB|nr:TonB-dependent receptor [Noviherbaspirillum sp. UKPF54]